jgi:predicted nucleic acid-binding protein
VILVDTGPLVALCDPRDRLHRVALRDLDRLARRTLVVPDAVLAECCFHLPHPVQRTRLARLLVSLAPKPYDGADVAELRGEVFDWLVRYGEHEPDWVDGWLAVVSGREKRWRVWTYDAEFHTTWRRPDGTRIPFAVAPGTTRS